MQRPLLRVMTPLRGQFIWLHHGRAGNLQTAAEMARLVREDAWRDEGLKRWAAQLLINAGLDSHSDQQAILDTIFRYVQRVTYIADAGGDFDAIASARETIANGYGDCDDLAVLLATLLALLGFTPAFVLAKYSPDGDGFDHVYVEAETPRGDHVMLDPTTRKYGVGWENPRAIDKLIFPIFGAQGTFNALGDTMQLATQGAAIGLSFVPVVGPILGALVGPVSGLFSKAQQKAEEAARWDGHETVMQGMTQIQAAVDSCQITAAQGVQAAKDLVSNFYRMCDQFTKKSVAQSCRNYETEAGGFTYRQDLISKAGSNCARVGAGRTGGSGSATAGAAAGSIGDGGLSGLSGLLPVVLLVGGAYLLLK